MQTAEPGSFALARALARAFGGDQYYSLYRSPEELHLGLWIVWLQLLQTVQQCPLLRQAGLGGRHRLC